MFDYVTSTVSSAASWGFEQGLKDVGRATTWVAGAVVIGGTVYGAVKLVGLVSNATSSTTDYVRRTWREAAADQDAEKREFEEFKKARDAQRASQANSEHPAAAAA
jgi:hypothetical protein